MAVLGFTRLRRVNRFGRINGIIGNLSQGEIRLTDIGPHVEDLLTLAGKFARKPQLVERRKSVPLGYTFGTTMGEVFIEDAADLAHHPDAAFGVPAATPS